MDLAKCRACEMMGSRVRSLELGAFGRTARAGIFGSGTYVVWKRNVSWNFKGSQRRERAAKNRYHFERWSSQKSSSMMTCSFNFMMFDEQWRRLYPYPFQRVRNRFHVIVWLNSVEEVLSKIKEGGGSESTHKAEILRKFTVFKEDVNYKLTNGRFKLISEPGELNKLGRLYYSNNMYQKSMEAEVLELR